MDVEKLPIKFFAKRKVDEMRVEPGGSKDLPKWVLQDDELHNKSLQLLTGLDEFKNEVQENQKKDSIIPFTLVVQMCSDATSKSRRSHVSNLFQMNNTNKVIGLSNPNELVVSIDSIAEMDAVAERLQDLTRNSYAISCVEKFKRFEPMIVNDEVKGNYKVKLINFQDYERNMAVQKLFEKTIKEKSVELKKTEYSEDLIVYNLKNINKVILDDLKDCVIYKALLSIEPMPQYKVAMDSMDIDQSIKNILPNTDYQYSTVGILDNGIAKIPQLEPWISGRWSSYPSAYIAETHGTFVAGVALYGDLCENAELVGHNGIKLFDAVVFPDTTKEKIDEDELIENIKEAIAINHKKVKIWNLSISLTRPVCDRKFSDFAVALDGVQDKYNVLICKSAGNCDAFLHGRPKGRINEGADSIRALVVGSVAHAQGMFDLAKIDNPSPFSRIGPGPEYIIKPEISHYGGNAGTNDAGDLMTTGVKSFSKDGSLIAACGTSYSTPRIASLIAGIQQEIDEAFNPLLLKALAIHSATYSDKLKVPNNERTKQLGFGVPKNVKNIIYNTPHEVTLIMHDSLSKGEYIDIMDFPMPECLIKDGYFTGQIIATLVYDPILESSQGNEYCQSNIDVKFGSYDKKTDRDVTKRNILNPVGRFKAKNLFSSNLYSKTKMKENIDDFALKERLLIQYKDKYYPVKKYAIDLTELTDANKIAYLKEDQQWYLYIKGLFRDYIQKKANVDPSVQLTQEFCLILTIKDPLGKAMVYDGVAQKLNEYNFWNNNIKISSDIKIDVQ